MITIRIQSNELDQKLQELIQNAVDRRTLMRRISGIMLHAVEENFARGGRPKWPQLSQKTIKARQKRGYWPGQILQVTGRLAGSISTYSDNDQAVVGTNVVYAKIHQLGGKAGRGRKVEIPARPFLKLTDEDMETILNEVNEHLKLL